MKFLLIYTLLFVITLHSQAQTGVIKGRITNSINKEPIPFINVAIESSTRGTTTDIDGYYQIINLDPGEYNIMASGIGFKSLTNFEVQVNSFMATFLLISWLAGTLDWKRVRESASRAAG